MSLLTTWGYTVKDADTLPEMLEAIEYDQFTADKYAGDKRTYGNIMAAESAIRNYCGWHIFPELDCRLDTTFFDRRVTTAGRHILVQLPATYVTAVESIEIDKNAVNVIVSMFGRETSVEFELDQVEVVSQ